SLRSSDQILIETRRSPSGVSTNIASRPLTCSSVSGPSGAIAWMCGSRKAPRKAAHSSPEVRNAVCRMRLSASVPRMAIDSTITTALAARNWIDRLRFSHLDSSGVRDCGLIGSETKVLHLDGQKGEADRQTFYANAAPLEPATLTARQSPAIGVDCGGRHP